MSKAKKGSKAKKAAIVAVSPKTPKTIVVKSYGHPWPPMSMVETDSQNPIVFGFMQVNFSPSTIRIVNLRYGNKGGTRPASLAASGRMASVSKDRRIEMKNFLMGCIGTDKTRFQIITEATEKFPEYRPTTFGTILRDTCNTKYVNVSGLGKLARKIGSRNGTYEWI